MKNILLNVLVDPNQYKDVKNFKAGSIAISNTRSNSIKVIKNTDTVIKKSMPKKVRIKSKPSPMK